MTNALLSRRAVHSDVYVQKIDKAMKARMAKTGSTTIPKAEKQARLAAILSDKTSFMQRIGQQMVGPIQLKLRYAGLLRSVLLEDPLTPGVPVEYDVIDELGQAYILHGNEGEVKVTPFEGKRAPVRLFRIAAFPQIKKEDLYYLRTDMVEYAQDETKQAIMKQEDARLITLLDAAITAYGGNANNPFPGAQVINELSSYVTPESFYDAVAMIERRELFAATILMNPVDFRDLNKWDLNDTGFAFKDRVVAGETITEFAGFQIQRSIMVPAGKIYIIPEAKFLGVFPVMYSLDVEENPTPAKFHKGWVMDELVGMAVLNPRGLARIDKA